MAPKSCFCAPAMSLNPKFSLEDDTPDREDEENEEEEGEEEEEAEEEEEEKDIEYCEEVPQPEKKSHSKAARYTVQHSH